MPALLKLVPNGVKFEHWEGLLLLELRIPASLRSRDDIELTAGGRPWSRPLDGPPLMIFASTNGNRFWLYERKLWLTQDPDLLAADVAALADEAGNRRRMQLEKAHALQAMNAELDQRQRRPAIPQDVKIAVWQRDGGRCVECGAQADLEFDHIIPLAMGGANSVRNLQLLCGTCNRRKGATLG